MSRMYLRTFFDEKDLPLQMWTLTDDAGMSHIISNEVVIEQILEATHDDEVGALSNMLRRIDFANGDVNDFLKHLAGALINQRTAS